MSDLTTELVDCFTAKFRPILEDERIDTSPFSEPEVERIEDQFHAWLDALESAAWRLGRGEVNERERALRLVRQLRAPEVRRAFELASRRTWAVAHGLLSGRSAQRHAAAGGGGDGDPDGHVDWIETICGIEIVDCDRLARPLLCLREFSVKQFEDSFTWLKCFYTCSDLNPLAVCIQGAFAACTRFRWAGEVLIRLFVEYVDMVDCGVQLVSLERTELREGDGRPVVMRLQSPLPPAVYCLRLDDVDAAAVALRVLRHLLFGQACSVQLQISFASHLDAWRSQRSLQNLIRIGGPVLPEEVQALADVFPMCRSGRLLARCMVGRHEHAAGSSGEQLCRIDIRPEGWNDTFAVPLVAVNDGKPLPDRNMSVTLKTYANGAPLTLEKIPITVRDSTPGQPSSCKLLAGPHVTTFDGRHYNALFEGVFVVFVDSRPQFATQIQLTRQSCALQTVLCSCALAIQTHDDVIAVDRCRRANDTCREDGCRTPALRVLVNGNLTRGTQLWSKDDGSGWEVLLHDGLLVRVAATGPQLQQLNVWVIPTGQHRGDVARGLCGVFNGDPQDDFVGRDGRQLDNDTLDGGTPRLFVADWRVPEEDRILSGVLPLTNETADPADPADPAGCNCHHLAVLGTQCQCQRGRFDVCDVNPGAPVDASLLGRRSPLAARWDVVGRPLPGDGIDMDETFDPAYRENVTSDERDFCEDLLREVGSGTRKCRNMFCAVFPVRNCIYQDYVNACLDVVKVSGNTSNSESMTRWMLQPTRYECVDQFNRATKFYQSDYDSVLDGWCLHDCTGSGECVNGSCVCEHGAYGPDCSVNATSAASGLLDLPISGSSRWCDLAHENCSVVAVDHGVPGATVTCYENGKQLTVFRLSTYQSACVTTSTSSSRSIHVEIVRKSLVVRQEIYVTEFDSTCQLCNTSSRSCVYRQTGDYCVISGICFRNLYVHQDDECYHCNASASQADWSFKEEDVECLTKRSEEEEKKRKEDQERVIRIAIASSLSVLVVIVTIVLFFTVGRQDNESATLPMSAGAIYDNEIAPDKWPSESPSNSPSNSPSDSLQSTRTTEPGVGDNVYEHVLERSESLGEGRTAAADEIWKL